MVAQKRLFRRRSFSTTMASDDIDDLPRNRANSTSLPGKVEMKPAVVIGNGPSAITLSYMLAGWRPYYNGSDKNPHPDEYLHMRLTENPDVSLVEQDLEYLSQGLTGRSKNPVALLFDTLQHPNSDFGEDHPSCLTWRHEPEKAIDHVVLGKGPPGGSWQAMDGQILTISLGSWMELPDMPLRDSVRSEDSRASVSAVANYYSHYVDKKGLRKYFRNQHLVTSVRRVTDPDSLRDNLCGACEEPYLFSREEHTCMCCSTEPIWEVEGFSEKTKRSFRFLTPNVIIAVGGNDVPNSLQVSGEDLPFVLKSLNDLEKVMASGGFERSPDPVLIVGAGLSAADAIIAARHSGIPVIHAFRRGINDPGLIFRQLPPMMYPEYHKIYQMMVDGGTTYPGYKSLPKHAVAKILPDRTVFLQGPESSGKIRVSFVVSLVGSRPNLNFLEKSGLGLGSSPDSYITTKSNPILVDCFSMESVMKKGLYAMGPLVGDNFVRFAQGSALPIVKSIAKSVGKKSVR